MQSFLSLNLGELFRDNLPSFIFLLTAAVFSLYFFILCFFRAKKGFFRFNKFIAVIILLIDVLLCFLVVFAVFKKSSVFVETVDGAAKVKFFALSLNLPGFAAILNFLMSTLGIVTLSVNAAVCLAYLIFGRKKGKEDALKRIERLRKKLERAQRRSGQYVESSILSSQVISGLIGNSKTKRKDKTTDSKPKELTQALESIQKEMLLLNANENIEKEESSEENYSETVEEESAEENCSETVEEESAEEGYSETIEEGNAEESYSETVEEESAEETYGETVEEESSEENYSETIEEESTEENYSETVEEENAEENYSETVEEENAEENYSETIEEESAEENYGETIEDESAEENYSETVEEEAVLGEEPAVEDYSYSAFAQSGDSIFDEENAESEETETIEYIKPDIVYYEEEEKESKKNIPPSYNFSLRQINRKSASVTAERPIISEVEKLIDEEKTSVKNEKPIAESEKKTANKKPSANSKAATGKEAKPAAKKPVAKKPAEQKPVKQKPAVKEPVEQKPAVKEPVEQKPAVKEPVEQKPAVKEPVEQKPAVKEPVIEKVVALEKPVTEKPAAKKSAPKKPTNQKEEAKPQIKQEIEKQTGTHRVVSGTVTSQDLPVTRRYVVQNRMNAVNVFSEYLNTKNEQEKKRLEAIMNSLIKK